MLTLAILIWPGLPVALGAAFWAVDLIGRITRCKEGELSPTDPLKSRGRRQGECSVGGVSQVGTAALESLRKRPRRGLKTGWQAWNWGRSGIWHGPGKRNAFLSVLIPLIAPCCSQPSPIRTGKPLSDSKAFLLTPLPLCPRYTVPCPNTVKITTGSDAR